MNENKPTLSGKVKRYAKVSSKLTTVSGVHERVILLNLGEANHLAILFALCCNAI